MTDIVIGSHHHQLPCSAGSHPGDPMLDSLGGTLDSTASDLCLRGPNIRGAPRLAPQCGSHISLLSLTSGQHPASNGPKAGQHVVSVGQHLLNGGAATTGLFRPSPRSLQVSPALTQRSLYAQHVLSAPEIAPSSSSNELRPSRSAATNVTSEFSFMRPDSPLQRHINTAPSSARIYQRSNSCSTQGLSTPLHHAQPPVNPQTTADTRPNSIHGQGMQQDKPTLLSHQPPDVVPLGTYVRGTREQTYGALQRRRHYTHSKSDSSFLNPQPTAADASLSKGPLR